MRAIKIIMFATVWLAYGAGVFPAADAAQSSQHYGYPASDVADLRACVIEHGGTPSAGAWSGVSRRELDACRRAGVWNWDARIPG